jgi:hypothetical protein
VIWAASDGQPLIPHHAALLDQFIECISYLDTLTLFLGSLWLVLIIFISGKFMAATISGNSMAVTISGKFMAFTIPLIFI